MNGIFSSCRSGSKRVYLSSNDIWGGTPLEERYLNTSRRSQGRRAAPAQSQPPRRRRDDDWDDDWDDRPRKTAQRRRSGVVGVLKGFYIFLVVISAVIVAVYIGAKVMIKPPEQSGFTPPNQQGGNTTPSSGGVSTVDPGVTPAGLERKKGVYTVFLAATDKAGTLTDVMMVMRYDTNAQTVGVISIPRDTLVARQKGNPHLVYGGGGVEQRIKDVSDMLGVPIDCYVKVNIKGFIRLVDYLDGVDFYVPCDMNYDDPEQDLSIHYTEGTRHLMGQQAMEVARFRKNNDGSGYSDVGRTQTQQKLLVALAKKVLSWNNLTRINGFVEIFNDNVDTDLSLNEMLYFASQAVNLDPSTGVETATLPGRGDGVYRGYRYCYELDPEGTLELVNRLINPYSQDLTLDDMNLAKADKYM